MSKYSLRSHSLLALNVFELPARDRPGGAASGKRIKGCNRILSSNYAFQESLKARQDTLAVVSHDLRAPLNNVLLCSRMISSANLDPNLRRFTGMIDRSSGQMEKLI